MTYYEGIGVGVEV